MIIHSDSKFFTNEPERDLYTRFANILTNGTKFFDVLVGYFRSSGFFRLYHALDDVQSIRILVGLNVDKITHELITYEQAKNKFAGKIIQEFENSPVEYQVEEGAKKFIEWLKSGKLQMRMYPNERLHAKVYIIRRENDSESSVVTGSSNFSEAGLINNLEFNVELKDESDVKFALDKFESLWRESIDISQIYIETIEQRTWLRSDITPYEIYLKTLREFFYQELKDDSKSFTQNYFPDDFMRLQYQIDAVIQAHRMLETYGGVFISDVVGLGKTYICAMLAKIFLVKGKKLIICPPVLVDYWREVMRDFDVAARVESLGKLDNILNGKDDYEYVFIDEAHRFRNSDTAGYAKLHEICYGKKVILISATPINNYSSDIENQIYLFQPRHMSSIPGVRNLEAFFKRLNDGVKDLEGKEYLTQLNENSRQIRSKILRHIMIRRTRSEIAKYYHDDMTKQGLTFPEIGEPEKIIYTFDDRINAIFQETLKAIKDFKYSRYKPLTYLKDTSRFASLLTSQNNMGGFMKSLLVKRLESSFHAFRQTLTRFIESYKRFIDMYNTGKIFIGKNIDFDAIFESGLTDDEISSLIEDNGGYVFEAQEFDTKFIIDLTQDLFTLERLKTLWDTVKSDPKLEKFIEELQSNAKLSPVKKIIFTESTETAEYLEANLRKIYDSRVISFSGKSSKTLKAQIERSFNPKLYSEDSDSFDILITTDILSEGVNLHRSNIIINYDLPWNPTRIMQRVGRINRVGTQHENIYVFNFFPTAQSAKHMPLEQRILEKLQLFNQTLGNDIKYLSDKEEVSPKKLFDELTAKIDSDNEDSEGELKYLEVIRSVRDNDPRLYERIINLPAMSKTGKLSASIDSDSTLTFIRKGALKEFYLNARQVPFSEAIKLLECEPSERAVGVESSYFTQYKDNNSAFDESLKQEGSIRLDSSPFTKSDKDFINLMKALRSDKTFTHEQLDILSRLLNACRLGIIPARIIKDSLRKIKTARNALEAFSIIAHNVPKKYLLTSKELAANQEGSKHVILSCYIKKGF